MSLPLFFLCVVFCLSISSSRCLRSVILCRMIRRSISSCVSPGPLSPTLPLPPPLPEPPPCRSRCVQSRCSLGSMYRCCASSTCVFASAVWALMAKMSRMSEVRSSIFTFSSFSILRICFAESSSSKMTIPTSLSLSSSSFINCLISSSLPCPTYVTELGPLSRWVNLLTVTAPAVSARNSSSSRYSFVLFSSWSLVIRPTSTAVSAFASEITNSFIK